MSTTREFGSEEVNAFDKKGTGKAVSRALLKRVRMRRMHTASSEDDSRLAPLGAGIWARASRCTMGLTSYDTAARTKHGPLSLTRGRCYGAQDGATRTTTADVVATMKVEHSPAREGR